MVEILIRALSGAMPLDPMLPLTSLASAMRVPMAEKTLAEALNGMRVTADKRPRAMMRLVIRVATLCPFACKTFVLQGKIRI